MNAVNEKYLFDSNVFDYILDYGINIEHFRDKGIYYTTNVQKSELKNVKDVNRRKLLLKIYNSFPQKKIATDSGIWLDDLHWDDEEIWTDEISDVAIAFTENLSNKPWKDALIATIADKHKLILITSDKNFIKRAKNLGIKVVDTKSFFDLTSQSN